MIVDGFVGPVAFTNHYIRIKPPFLLAQIYVSVSCIIVGSDNGLSSIPYQAIIWTSFCKMLTKTKITLEKWNWNVICEKWTVTLYWNGKMLKGTGKINRTGCVMCDTLHNSINCSRVFRYTIWFMRFHDPFTRRDVTSEWGLSSLRKMSMISWKEWSSSTWQDQFSLTLGWFMGFPVNETHLKI